MDKSENLRFGVDREVSWSATQASWATETVSRHRSRSETSDEGLGPRADHYRSLVVDENDIDSAVRQYALLEFVP
jgi:hypothetical protein